MLGVGSGLGTRVVGKGSLGLEGAEGGHGTLWDLANSRATRHPACPQVFQWGAATKKEQVGGR